MTCSGFYGAVVGVVGVAQPASLKLMRCFYSQPTISKPTKCCGNEEFFQKEITRNIYKICLGVL